MKYIDLHTHTIESDGSLDPKTLVKQAKLQGLSAIAITDHDTISGIEKANQAANELGNIEVISGIELTSNYNEELHILGYFIDITNSEFLSNLNYFNKIRKKRNEKLIKKLQKHKIEITLEELKLEANNNNIIGRSHFASLLVKKSYVNSYTEAFNKYLSSKGICFVPKEKISPKKAISIIQKSGGLAILAHPYLNKFKNKLEYEKLFIKLKSFGLDGIEVYHSDHPKAWIKIFLELSKKLNLLVTGGSDFHGTYKPDIFLGNGRGNLSISYDILNSMKKIINEKNK